MTIAPDEDHCATVADAPSKYLAHHISAMEACSLEVMSPPIVVETQQQQDRRCADNDGCKYYWPMAVGCYHLDSSTGVRKGSLDVHMISCQKKEFSMQQQEKPATLSSTMSGVLDGKWLYPNGRGGSRTMENPGIFASAHADGTVRVSELCVEQKSDDLSSSSTPLGKLSQLSSSSEHGEIDKSISGRLCLSLDWDDVGHHSSEIESEALSSNRKNYHIASSYSDGSLAVHSVVLISCNNNEENIEFDHIAANRRTCKNSAEIETLHAWRAHSLHGNIPAEVWTTCFLQSTSSSDWQQQQPPSLVLSGGDDALLKLWDLRNLTVPAISRLGRHEAGVTSLCAHPTDPHSVLSGGYDGMLRLWDIRMASGGESKGLGRHVHRPLGEVDVGGGVWRIRWHPEDASVITDRKSGVRAQRQQRVLVAAMHGGCKVVQISSKNGSEDIGGLSVVSEFCNHESMAYGADWMWGGRDDDGATCSSLAASCSFYDKQAFIWNPMQCQPL